MNPPWFLFSNTSSAISKEKINWTQILFIKGLIYKELLFHLLVLKPKIIPVSTQHYSCLQSSEPAKLLIWE